MPRPLPLLLSSAYTFRTDGYIWNISKDLIIKNIHSSGKFRNFYSVQILGTFINDDVVKRLKNSSEISQCSQVCYSNEIHRNISVRGAEVKLHMGCLVYPCKQKTAGNHFIEGSRPLPWFYTIYFSFTL